MMRIRHFQGEGYTLTLIRVFRHGRNKGNSKSTIEIRDLTGQVFDTWRYENGKWQNSILGNADSIDQILNVYNGMDISNYIQEASNRKLEIEPHENG